MKVEPNKSAGAGAMRKEYDEWGIIIIINYVVWWWGEDDDIIYFKEVWAWIDELEWYGMIDHISRGNKYI